MSASSTRTLRRHLIEAMERRAAGQEDELRQILDRRLALLRAADVGRVEGDRPGVGPTAVRGPLGELVDALAAGDREPPTERAAYPELPSLDAFRRIWSRVRTESQLRQSMAPVPENAGPLNSSALVHRAIALMRESSPGYLQHFLAYVDDLSWMERVGDGVAGPAGSLQPATIGKRARKKPRK
ncbi:DUF2894 domain-containing protein [Dyella sp. 333MFSha]|uniref:DUF2894 domain-containing protein n=1 Tax=Dyella sp. 333MFSha TaxID=1798240 RepID=UPI000B1ED534|nr:DUF2894 domain-containing protein [Dyella sp. 333MFSha]